TAVKQNAAFAQLDQAHDGAQQGGLAGAVASHHRVDRTLRQVGADVAQNRGTHDVGAEIFELQHVRLLVQIPSTSRCTVGSASTVSGSPSAAIAPEIQAATRVA